MANWAIVLASMLILCLCSVGNNARGQSASHPVLSDATNRISPKITMYVYNYANVPQIVLKEAEKRILGLFRRAGIETVWVNHQGGEVFSISQQLMPRATHIVRIFGRAQAIPIASSKWTMAYTTNPIVTVFYDRVSEEAKVQGLSIGFVFGYVLAHEIGHLFLDPGYHAPTGVMKPVLKQQDWKEAGQWRVCFSPIEAKKMQDALAARRK